MNGSIFTALVVVAFILSALLFTMAAIFGWVDPSVATIAGVVLGAFVSMVVALAGTRIATRTEERHRYENPEDYPRRYGERGYGDRDGEAGRGRGND